MYFLCISENPQAHQEIGKKFWILPITSRKENGLFPVTQIRQHFHPFQQIGITMGFGFFVLFKINNHHLTSSKFLAGQDAFGIHYSLPSLADILKPTFAK